MEQFNSREEYSKWKEEKLQESKVNKTERVVYQDQTFQKKPVKIPLYKTEEPLFVISLIMSISLWLTLMLGTLGMALLYIPFVFIGYLFAQSALISYLKGSAVKITKDQFSDIHDRVQKCCDSLGMANPPDAYLLHGDGIFNAFATRFLGRNFIVLYSDIVDALEKYPAALNFYIGHELGHIHRNHLLWGPVLLPASFLPLIGSAYSRAREYTCDLYGLHCCENVKDALLGLSALAAGGRRWARISIQSYIDQAKLSGDFWMSLHELMSDYPWLVKRVAHIRAKAANQEPDFPSRNVFAWILAFLIPRTFAKSAGSFIAIIIIFSIIASTAIPAYLKMKELNTNNDSSGIEQSKYYEGVIEGKD